MATTNIELDIENVTGVTDADDQFIISAQKLIVSSVPKDLMWPYANETNNEDTPATAPTTYVTGTTSGTKVTKVGHGLSYHDVVTIVNYGGTGLYNDTWKIFDVDSDNFHIAAAYVDNHATKGTYSREATFNSDTILSVRRGNFEASEVSKALRGFLTDKASLHYPSTTYPKYYIDKGAAIISPAPSGNNGYVVYVDFGKLDDNSDLRKAVVNYAAASEFSKLATGSLPSWSGIAAPVTPGAPSFGTALTISSSAPSPPFINVASVNTAGWTVPSYTKPVASLSSAPTISNLSISVSTPTVPVLSSNSISFSSSAPTYTQPVLSLVAAPSISNLSISALESVSPVLTNSSVSTSGLTVPIFTAPIMQSPDWADVDNWVDTQEDSEMLGARVNAIQAQIAEYQALLQGAQAEFNDDNVEYQAKIQIAIQDAQLHSADDAQALQKYANDVQSYTAQVNKEVQEYQQNLAGDIQVWQSERQTDIQKYSADIQNAVNTFNQSNVEYQADLQVAIQNAQLSQTDDSQTLQKYSSEVQIYQSEVSKEVQEYQQNLQGDLQVWQSERTTDLQLYASDIQNETAEFNKDLNIYQAEIQASIQDAQLESAEEAQKIQKYSSEIQAYQNDVNREVQAYSNTLNKNMQEYSASVQKYSAEIQAFQMDVAEQTAEQNVNQQKVAFYSQESDRYYKMGQLEVTQFIQNNSKMINTQLAAKQSAQIRS